MFFFMGIPGILPAGSLAAASFGITSSKSFNAALSTLNRVGLPLPSVRTVISLQKEKTDAGEDYSRVIFDVLSGGQPRMTCKNREDYLSKIKPVLDKIIATHRGAIEQAEKSRALSHENGPIIQTTPRDSEDHVGHEFKDEIPF
jgi:hypothetical protein